MKDLVISFDRESKQKISGDTIDFGEWDIAVGAEFTVYVHNPNTYAKAVIEDLTHSDKRVVFDFPREIQPNETIPVKFSLPAVEFASEEQEEDYFKDVFDQLVGQVKWKRP